MIENSVCVITSDGCGLRYNPINDSSLIREGINCFIDKNISTSEKFEELIEQLEKEGDNKFAAEIRDLLDLKEGVQNELSFALEQFEGGSSFYDEDWYAAKINALCHAQGISAENYVPDRCLDHEREKELFGY